VSRDPNDDRSDRYNPNNDSYWAAEANEGRGDDWDEDDGSNHGTAEPPPELTELVIKDCGKTEGWDPLPARTACAPFVMDRASHVLFCVDQLLRLVWGFRYETPESAERRKAKLCEIERVAADFDAAVKEGRYEVETRRSGERCISHVDIDSYKSSIQEYARECRLGWEGRTVWTSCGYLAECDRIPDPEMVTFDWKRTFERVRGSLLGVLAAAAAEKGDRGDAGALAVIGTARANTGCFPARSPDPIAWRVQRFGTDAELFEFGSRIKRETAFTDERGLPLLFPRGEPGAPAAISPAALARTIIAVDWMLAAFARSWDPTPVLDALWKCSSRAESAGAPLLVFGVGLKDVTELSYGPKSVQARYASAGAVDRSHAAALRRAFVRRRLRTIVLPCPTVNEGPTWTAVDYRDGLWGGSLWR
jgi:hypothetical protein